MIIQTSAIRAFRLTLLAWIMLLASFARAQSANLTQQLDFAGLRSSNNAGAFNAVGTDAAGNLYLLLDQHDGVRLLKTDPTATTVLAQAQLGAAGDSGLAMALSPNGQVFVTGSTSSSSLQGTSGAAIPQRTDASINSFVAGFDAALNPLFVTFTGGSRILASSIAATHDALFITGYTYGSNLPVTRTALEITPPYGSSQNGFVERFSLDGSTLVYATYLSGANGNTSPAAIAADASDNAYIAGYTSSTAFPAVAALVPVAIGTGSGFVSKLDAAGDALTFSTFIPGAGVTSAALNSTGSSLLVSGSIALGQFPVLNVGYPVLPTTTQVLLRLSLDGSSLLASTALAPGTQSALAPGPNGETWITGTLSTPILPIPALSNVGLGFAVRVNTQNEVDQTVRFGGLPTSNLTYASLPLTLNSIVVDHTGEPVLAGTLQPTASQDILSTETYDLPLTSATAALPSSLSDAIPTPSTCLGSLCNGAAAFLAKLNSTLTAPALTLSTQTLPVITVRNLGSAGATNLQISSSGPSTSTTCGSSLYAASECDVLIGSGGPSGTLTISADNTATRTITIPAIASTANQSLVFSPHELDFGLHTSTSPPTTQTITVTNLSQQSQTFLSKLDASLSTFFSLSATTCTLSGAMNTYQLAPGAACQLTLVFTPSTISTNDGPIQSAWLVGTEDVLLTAFTEAASLHTSTSEVDFGTQYTGGLRLSRFLYLSNDSAAAAAHTQVTLPTSTPFAASDSCPTTLEPRTTCSIRLDYLPTASTETDSFTLNLDQGLSVLLTGSALPPPTAGASTTNPSISTSTQQITFATPVAVTAVSATTQTITVSNSGPTSTSLTLQLTGDFTDATNCTSTIAAHTTCSIVITFAPGQPGQRDGALSITTGSSTPSVITLSGTGTAILPANNGSLTSSTTPVQQPSVTWYKVSQSFSQLKAQVSGPFTVLLVQDIGYGYGSPAASAFSAVSTSICTNCYLGIQFTPTSAGVRSGTLNLSSVPAGTPYVLTLNGVGVATSGLILSPTTQDFGSVPVNSTSGPTSFTLTNATGADVTLSAPSLTGDFAFSSAASGTQDCSNVLPSTATCLLSVHFAPTFTGTRAGQLSIPTSAGTSSASLTGFALPDPGLALNPTSVTFTSVPGIASTQQTITLTNTGTASAQIGTVSSSNSAFTVSSPCTTLAPAATCTATVTFAPTTQTISASLTVPVTSSIGGQAPTTSTYTVPLAGAYTSQTSSIQILPAQIEFGAQTTGSLGQSRQLTLTNLTGTPLAISLTLPRQFVLNATACNTLAPAATCTASVAFVPLENGDITGTFSAQGTSASGPAVTSSTYLEGYGAGSGTLSVTGGLQTGPLLNFGQVTSGQTTSRTLTVTNLASTAITVRRITSQAPFLTSTTCGAALATSQACTVTVTYRPINQVASGTSSPRNLNDAGTLVIDSDAVNAPLSIKLSGVAAPVSTATPGNTTALATYTVSSSSLTLAATAVGNASPTQTITLTNSGTQTLHLGQPLTSANFSVQSTCATLIPTATCTFSVAGTPQFAGTLTGAMVFSSDSTTPLDYISLITTGTLSGLSFTPGSLSFGSVTLGSSATQTIQIANSTAASITLGTLVTTGDFSQTNNCPQSPTPLTPGATCTVTIAFSPTQTGARSGSLSVNSSANTLPLTVAFTGIGTQSNLQVTPSGLIFGFLNVGASSAQIITLTNSGSGPANSLAFTITGDYTISGPCGTTTLPPAGSCAVQITFAPTQPGTRAGLLTISSSDPSSPVSIPLSGTGATTGGFSLTVDGAASSSVSVPSRAPATYRLAVTPLGGFSGPVVLTCNPVTPGPYATCAINSPTLTLAASADSATVTINTVTATNGNASLSPGKQLALLCLLLPLVPFARPRIRRAALLTIFLMMLPLSGCGGGSSSSLVSTPAGTYTYQVQATSTSGQPITQTVNLTLVVQ